MEKDILTTEEMTQEIEVEDYETECSGGKLGKAVGVGLILALGGAGVALFKKKIGPKLEAAKVEGLRKKGYVIYKEDEVEIHEVEVDDVQEEDSEE